MADAAGVVRLAQGNACVHSGGVLHGGRRVTAGRRTLLVGFVDTVRDAGRGPAPCSLQAQVVGHGALHAS